MHVHEVAHRFVLSLIIMPSKHMYHYCNKVDVTQNTESPTPTIAMALQSGTNDGWRGDKEVNSISQTLSIDKHSSLVSDQSTL